MHGRDEKLLQNFVRKLEEKRQIGRPTHRWKDNISMNSREIGWEVVVWMHVA
jgi:hypothetical protein